MNYAVLADLNATRANCTSFLNALKELDGNIIYCKFYSYNPKRDCGFSRYIRSAGLTIPNATAVSAGTYARRAPTSPYLCITGKRCA